MLRLRGPRSRPRQMVRRASAPASTSSTPTPPPGMPSCSATRPESGREVYAIVTSIPLLAQLAEALARGDVKIVDLTQPLGPATPVIGLPPIFAPSPGVTIEEISRYDERGPAWYWNTLRFGEHTGTHFDAPIHWATGRDLPNNACDTIPPERFIGPACVIDVTEPGTGPESRSLSDVDFLLTPERIE